MSDRKRIANNALFLVLLTFSSYFLGLLLYPYLSRILSIENFGLFGFATSFVLIFQTIIEFGFMISTTASISKNREDAQKVSKIISATMQAKLLLTGVSLILFAITGYFVPMVRDHFLFIFLFFLSSAITALIPDFFYRGIEKMKSITVRTVAIRVLMILLVVLLVKDDSQLILIPVAFIIANVIALAIALVGVSREGVRFQFVTLRQTMLAIQEGAMFFLSRLAVSMNQSLGTFFLGLRYSPLSLELGLFSGASKISAASEMPVVAVSDSLYPHMVKKKDYRLFFKVLALGSVGWFVACILFWIFAPQIAVLLLGSDFEQAGDVLRILIFGNFMSLFANWFGYPVLSPIGLARHANIAVMVAAVINVLALTILWATDSISLLSVSLVIACTNLVVFGYRVGVFWRNRELTRSVSDKGSQ